MQTYTQNQQTETTTTIKKKHILKKKQHFKGLQRSFSLQNQISFSDCVERHYC